MSPRKRITLLALGVLLLVLVVVLPAQADVLQNVAPPSQLPSGALADQYPLGRYLLDHHFDAVKAGVLSGVDVSGIPPTIAWFLAQAIWQLTAFLTSTVITLFTFAFSLDLVNGSSATGGQGALAPVADAIRTIYRDIFGAPWLTVAVTLAGLWAMWTALVRRRYAETAGALAMSLVFVVVALAFVTQPERTIGTASRWSNQMSAAFLSLSSNGTVTDHDSAKREISDQLFQLLIYDPWVVLNFGGIEHCVSDGDDPTSVPVRPLSPSPGRDAQLARQLAQGQQVEAEGKTCVNHRTKYAPHFLRFDFESDQRDAEYEALKAGDSGKLPDEDPGKRDGTYRLSGIDKPAAEAMGKGGQYQRLGLAVVIFIGELGVLLLLGSLSVAVILAQVLVLLLLAFAPVALVAAVFPGRGHDAFLGWLQRLAAFLLRKAIYSLILAVLLAVAAALADASANLGWLMAFGLQAVFFWSILLYRKQLAGQLTTTLTGTTGTAAREGLPAGGLVALYAAARLTRRALRRPGTTPTPRPAAGAAPARTTVPEIAQTAPVAGQSPAQPTATTEAPGYEPAGGPTLAEPSRRSETPPRGTAQPQAQEQPGAVKQPRVQDEQRPAVPDTPRPADRNLPASPSGDEPRANPEPASSSRAHARRHAPEKDSPTAAVRRPAVAPTDRAGRPADREAAGGVPQPPTSPSFARPAPRPAAPDRDIGTQPPEPGVSEHSSAKHEGESSLLNSLRSDAQRLHPDPTPPSSAPPTPPQPGPERRAQPPRPSASEPTQPPPVPDLASLEILRGGEGQ